MESYEEQIRVMREKIRELEIKIEEEKQRNLTKRIKYEQIEQLKILLKDRRSNWRRYGQQCAKVGIQPPGDDDHIFAILGDIIGEIKFRVDELWESHPPVIELRKKQSL
jgi:hypothetical protein